MTGFEAYCLYNALSLHFKLPNFDYFKYNGKTTVTLESFEKRNDKYTFIKLSRKYTDTNDLSLFFISNIIEDNASWSGNFLDEKANELFIKHQKILQSMTYVFSEECKKLFENLNNPNEPLLVKGGEYPQLLTYYLQSKLSLETLCLLNIILGFLPRWSQEISDTIQWPMIQRKMEKFSCFLPKNVVKYKLLLRDVLNTTS